MFHRADSGDVTYIKELLKKGGDIDKQSSDDGSTVLMLATKGGHIKLIEHLLIQKANTKLTSNNGETALQIAKDLEADEIVELIELFE